MLMLFVGCRVLSLLCVEYVWRARCVYTFVFVVVVEVCGCTHRLIVCGVVGARYYVWIVVCVCVFVELRVHVVCAYLACSIKHWLLSLALGIVGYRSSLWDPCGVSFCIIAGTYCCW